MRYTDKIKYYAFTNDWTSHPAFEFTASVVASEKDVITAVLKESFFIDEDEIYVERVGNFHVYQLGRMGIFYYIRPETT
jgi:hypothetical protein